MSVNDTVYVSSRYGDPVRGGVRLITSNKGNAISGYYGFCRTNKEGHITYHGGFDYFAEEETTEVIAVGKGTIERVRFGRYSDDSKCLHKEYYKNNLFDYKKCEVCDYVSGCYGVQVWLKLDHSECFAFYAHLSKLDSKIFSVISNKLFGNTICNLNIKLNKGDVIGISGRSGNACKKEVEEPHLHFECRIGNGEVGTDISPNNIVKTGFFFKNDQGKICDKMEREDKLSFDSKERKEVELEVKERTLLQIKEPSIAEKIQLQSIQAQILWNKKSYCIFKINQHHLI